MLTIFALKTRNPIVFAFHPSAQKSSAEAQGSLGVVLNGPTPLETVKEVCRVVDKGALLYDILVLMFKGY